MVSDTTMKLTKAATWFGAVLLVLALEIRGHVYQMEPVSRQFWRSAAFQDWDPNGREFCAACYNARGPEFTRERQRNKTDEATFVAYGNGSWPLKSVYDRGEMAENGNYIEPEQVSVRHGVCGDPKQTAGEDWNVYGTPNEDWPILATYKQGQAIEIKIVVPAYHWGHLEFFLCNSDDLVDPEGDVVTQECFNMHPLTRAEGDSKNSPIDPNYSGRYYLDPECRADETDQRVYEFSTEGYVVHMAYQLPEDVTCSRCIIQMVYYTGNFCKHPGYDEFEPSSWPSECAPDKEDWILTERDFCGENDEYPEEFWQCADIAITADGEPETTYPPALTATTLAPYSGSDTSSDSAASSSTGSAPITSSGTPSASVSSTTSTSTIPWTSSTPSASSETTSNESSSSESTNEELSSNKLSTDSTTISEVTNAPSTAPTASPAVTPGSSCSDPNEPYEQCGGTGWRGSTCCEDGFECTRMGQGKCYYECRPIEM